MQSNRRQYKVEQGKERGGEEAEHRRTRLDPLVAVRRQSAGGLDPQGAAARSGELDPAGWVVRVAAVSAGGVDLLVSGGGGVASGRWWVAVVC